MTLTDPNARRSTVARLVAEPEAVAAAPFAFAPREPDPAALAHGGLGLGMGGECPTKVDRGLLEHLRGDRLPPPQARHLLDDGAVRGNDKQPASLLGLLPSVERLNQVESRPRYPHLRVFPLGGKGLGDHPKALVVGEPRRPSMPGEHRRLRGGRSKGEPEGGVPHGTWDRTRRMRHLGTCVRVRAKAPPPRPQCRTSLRTRDLFDRLGQSQPAPGRGKSTRSTRGSCQGSPGPPESLPRTHRGLPGTAGGRTRERRSTLLRSPPEV